MSIPSGGKQILIHGMALVLAGFLWGLVVPRTPFPRLALTAHIQFESGGMLLIILAIMLLALPHSVGRKSIWIMVLAAWLTWPMVLSEVANAWWGTNKMLPITAMQAGATGAQPWQESILILTHVLASIALIAAWTLLMIGFIKAPRPTQSSPAPSARTTTLNNR